jgi:predicted metal-dependent peptidase
MHHFTLVTTDNEVVGVFTYAWCDWKPGDIIPQGSASLRVVDVIEPEERKSDGVEVGVLKVEPVSS